MNEAVGVERVASYLPTVLDAAHLPDDVAAWAAAVTPGPAVVTPLAALDPARLSPAGRVDALRALEKQLAWLQARQHELLAAMAAAETDTSVAGLDKSWVREEVACALRLSGRTATDRLCLAQALVRRPATLGLLAAGQISGLHARALAEAVLGLDETTAARVEQRVLGRAPEQSLANFRASLTRAVLALTPGKTGDEQHAEALTERRVTVTPADHGMTELWALLPAAGAAALMSALNALADRVRPDDPRRVDQRRADALVQLGIDTLTGRAGTGELPRTQRIRPAVQVTVALSTLLGADEQPAELDGHGPIPATLARRIAADPTGTWRRLVTDPTGRLLDYGRTTYRPPTDLAEYVIARDRTCRFAHCNRSARRCDIDHRTRFSDGGTTSPQNCESLCPRHHHLKDDDTGWTVDPFPDGDLHWTSPTGHTYRTPAATYPIDTTSAGAARQPSTTDPDPPPPF